jgi:hypothetical protein
MWFTPEPLKIECVRWNLSEARRAGVFFELLLLIRRGGDPSGAAATLVNGGGLKKSHLIAE